MLFKNKRITFFAYIPNGFLQTCCVNHYGALESWQVSPWSDMRFSNVQLHSYFHKQRIFSTQPQCCLTFSCTDLQMMLRCYLIHLSFIMLIHFLHTCFYAHLLQMKKANNFQIVKVQRQDVTQLLLDFQPISAWRCLSKCCF